MRDTEPSSGDNARPRPPEKPKEPLPTDFVLRGVRYGFVRLLGQGGMARVGLYEKVPSANEPATGDSAKMVPYFLALKEYKSHGGLTEQDHRRRGLKELVVSRMLRSKMHFSLKKLTYLLVPFIQGCSLDDLTCIPFIKPDVVVHMGYKILQSLVKMHEKNSIHLDVKPENIILTPEGELEIIDFDFTETRSGRILDRGRGEDKVAGTLNYVSPEMIKNKPLSTKADVYSVAHSLYAIAHRGTHFPADSDQDSVYSGHLDGLQLGNDGKLIGQFVQPLDAMRDAHLSSILKKMLMTDDAVRIDSTEALGLFRDECVRRGIDPDSPLLPPIPIDDPSAEVPVAEFINALNGEVEDRK